MELRLLIPTTKKQKSSFKSTTCFLSEAVIGSDREFTFSDVSTPHFFKILDLLRLPFYSADANNNKTYIPTIYVDEYPEKLIDTKGNKQTIYDLDKIAKIFNLSPNDVIFRFKSGSYCFIEDEETVFLGTQEYWLYNSSSINHIWTSDSCISDTVTSNSHKQPLELCFSLENNYYARDLKTDIDTKLKAIKEYTKAIDKIYKEKKTPSLNKITLHPVDLIPIPIHFSSFMPSVPDTIKKNSIMNRILNNITSTKFKGFSKLDSKGKEANITSRLSKLYADNKAKFDLIKQELPSLHDPKTITKMTNVVYSIAHTEESMQLKTINRETATALFHKSDLLNKFILDLVQPKYDFTSKVKEEDKKWISTLLTTLLFKLFVLNGSYKVSRTVLLAKNDIELVESSISLDSDDYKKIINKYSEKERLEKCFEMETVPVVNNQPQIENIGTVKELQDKLDNLLASIKGLATK